MPSSARCDTFPFGIRSGRCGHRPLRFCCRGIRLAACKMRQELIEVNEFADEFQSPCGVQDATEEYCRLEGITPFQSPCGVQDATAAVRLAEIILKFQSPCGVQDATMKCLCGIWAASFNRLAACKMRLYTEKNRRIFGAVSHFQGSLFAFPTKRHVVFCRIL